MSSYLIISKNYTCNIRFVIAGGGKLLEDIVRHGSHDIFCCYGFERDVAQYKKITSNHKTNEISYTSFYLRRCYTITHMNIKRDEDGLFPDSRGLLELHQYVRVPKYSWRDTVKNKTICDFLAWRLCGSRTFRKIGKGSSCGTSIHKTMRVYKND